GATDPVGGARGAARTERAADEGALGCGGWRANSSSRGDRLFAAVGGIEEMAMSFLKLFLRTIALIPGVVQGTEALLVAKTGEQKKKAAVEIVGAAINVADAVTMKHIANAEKFTEWLSTLSDGGEMCLNATLW